MVSQYGAFKPSTIHPNFCWARPAEYAVPRNLKPHKCRPVINNTPPFKGRNIRIPIIIPVKEGGLLIRGLHYLKPKAALNPKP